MSRPSDPRRPVNPSVGIDPKNGNKRRVVSRRVVLGAAAWAAPVIVIVGAAPALAASSSGTATLVSTSGSNGEGVITVRLEPDPATTPATTVAYDDAGATTTSFTKLGTDGTAGVYELKFATTTTPVPAAIAASLTVVGYGQTSATASMYVPGSIDTTFADPQFDKATNAVAVQPDKKILVAGTFTKVGTAVRRGLARLNADGTLDTTFDPKLDGDGNAVVVLSNNKILVAGTFSKVGATARAGLTRLNADGTLDTTFADPRLVGSTFAGVGNALALKSDGQILVAGSFVKAGAAGTARKHLARFNADGTLDTTFADPNLQDAGYGVAVQANDKVLVAGASSTAGAANTPRKHLARFNSDGTLDTTFADPNLNASSEGIAVLASGKILVSGGFDNAGAGSTIGYIRGLVRLESNGNRDTTFTNPNLLSGGGRGFAVQSDGKIVIGGLFDTAGAASTSMKGLARLNADGSLDATFTEPTPNHFVAFQGYGITVQPDHKILMAGNFKFAGPDLVSMKYLARFWG